MNDQILIDQIKNCLKQSGMKIILQDASHLPGLEDVLGMKLGRKAVILPKFEPCLELTDEPIDATLRDALEAKNKTNFSNIFLNDVMALVESLEKKVGLHNEQCDENINIDFLAHASINSIEYGKISTTTSTELEIKEKAKLCSKILRDAGYVCTHNSSHRFFNKMIDGVENVAYLTTQIVKTQKDGSQFRCWLNGPQKKGIMPFMPMTGDTSFYLEIFFRASPGKVEKGKFC